MRARQHKDAQTVGPAPLHEQGGLDTAAAAECGGGFLGLYIKVNANTGQGLALHVGVCTRAE